ncbi:MAG: peptidase MA domain-containing protein [Chloroflexi bacterium]|nr:peptidase MA domain-containing protein [Chloroflexota bacterium]
MKNRLISAILLLALVAVAGCQQGAATLVPSPTPALATPSPAAAPVTEAPPSPSPPSPAATVATAPVTPKPATPKPAPVASNIQLLDSGAAVDFAKTITFKVRAQSSVNITRMTLSYNVDRITVATVINEVRVNFTPSTTAEGQWVWDQRRGGPPGGATISYQWIIDDASGGRLRTEEKSFVYQDPRFDRTAPLTVGLVSLYWYGADADYGRTLMEAAQDALKRLAQDTGAQLERAVKIYVYPSYDELRSALIFPQEWTGGVAFTEFGVIAIGVPTNRAGVEYGKRTVSHELAHLVTFQVTFNPYGINVPPWLNEGLAKYAEGETEADYRSRIEKAIRDNKLFSVRSLSSQFSADTDEALLSYAQSESFARFLVAKYGRDSMLRYLGLFKQGIPAEEGLKQVYGLDYSSFDAAWRASVGARASAVPAGAKRWPMVQNATPWLPSGSRWYQAGGMRKGLAFAA